MEECPDLLGLSVEVVLHPFQRDFRTDVRKGDVDVAVHVLGRGRLGAEGEGRVQETDDAAEKHTVAQGVSCVLSAGSQEGGEAQGIDPGLHLVDKVF